jgi:hypothetical protein
MTLPFWHRALVAAQSGGGGGGGGALALVRQILNPNTSTNLPLRTGASEGPVENGNTVFSVASNRHASVASATIGMIFSSGSETPVTVLASTRYDTVGVSDGAGAGGRVAITQVENYTAGDYIYDGNGVACGLELFGTYTVSTVLAGQLVQGTESNPNVASVPNGDTYDALLVLCACGPDAQSGTREDSTSNYTPSVDMVYTAAKALSGGYRAECFIGIAPPSTDGITLVMTNKGFAASGWFLYVYGLTQN